MKKSRFTKLNIVFTFLAIASFVLAACGTTITIPGGPQPTATLSPAQQAQVAQVCATGGVAVVLEEGGDPIPCPPTSSTTTTTGGPAATAVPGSGHTTTGAAVPTTSTAFDQAATFSVIGAPESVDPSVVLRTQGADSYGNVFTNTVGLGSEMMFAEPGTLLVGPDFDPNTVKNSGGHIEWISPITQQMLGTETFSTNTAEGAFTWATGAKMTVKVGKFTIRVDSTADACSNNWFVVFRGLFADGKQDSDRNSTTKFSDYVAGHTQVMWYPAGAYISEGNFLQVAELSHTGGRNCGAEGTSGLSVLMLDLNTGAYTVLYQANIGQPWTAISSNWR